MNYVSDRNQMKWTQSVRSELMEKFKILEDYAFIIA
jgi:hypothetical protein